VTVRRLLAVVAWTLLVLVCSTGVWGVISTAGTGVTTSPEVPSTITSAAPSPRRVTTSPGSHPSTTARTPSSTREATPSTTPPPAIPGKPVETDEADDPRAPISQEPTEVRRTWQGTAGAVVASCRGATIIFRGAQPNSGWRVEVGNRGPEEIEVHFSKFQGEDEGKGEVELKARCTGGQPRFSTSGD
jgi:hypothetical protein